MLDQGSVQYPNVFQLIQIMLSTPLPDSKVTELGSSDQVRSAGKNTRKVLVPCCAWKWVPTAISGGVDISEVLWCHLLGQMSSQ